MKSTIFLSVSPHQHEVILKGMKVLAHLGSLYFLICPIERSNVFLMPSLCCSREYLKDDAVQVLHSKCQQIWKTQQWPWNWKRSVFISIPKKGNAEECSNYCIIARFPGGSEVKASARNVRDLGSIPGLGRSPGEGNGNPLQYLCLENPMEGGAW